MKKYQIGDMARVVALPQHVIRFYENYGIVDPSQQDDNNYRKYDSLDACKLVNSRLYRCLGFSLAEAAELVGKCSHEQVLDKLERRAEDINEQIHKLQDQLKRLSEIQDNCNNADGDLTRYRLIDRTGLYWIGEGNKEEFFLDGNSEHILKRWMEKLPLVYFLGVISKEAMLGEEEFNYSWGVAVTEEKAEPSLVKASSEVKYFPPCQAAYAVIEKEEDLNSLEPKHFEGLLKLIADDGLTVKGPVLVQLIEIISAGDKKMNRFGVSVPI